MFTHAQSGGWGDRDRLERRRVTLSYILLCISFLPSVLADSSASDSLVSGALWEFREELGQAA